MFFGANSKWVERLKKHGAKFLNLKCDRCQRKTDHVLTLGDELVCVYCGKLRAKPATRKPK